jgi:hypothetical protein
MRHAVHIICGLYAYSIIIIPTGLQCSTELFILRPKLPIPAGLQKISLHCGMKERLLKERVRGFFALNEHGNTFYVQVFAKIFYTPRPLERGPLPTAFNRFHFHPIRPHPDSVHLSLFAEHPQINPDNKRGGMG